MRASRARTFKTAVISNEQPSWLRAHRTPVATLARSSRNVSSPIARRNGRPRAGVRGEVDIHETPKMEDLPRTARASRPTPFLTARAAWVAASLVALAASQASTQPLRVPRGVAAAYAKGTRSRDGRSSR
jgi:hypothetical protein